MRRNNRIITFGIAALILLVILPACSSGMNISYRVSDDGVRYLAEAVTNDTDRFDFVQSGMMGERVPLAVSNISLMQNGTNATYTTEREGIRFARGNYSVQYEGRITGNAFQTLYSDPVRVRVILPERYRVDNPLLTSLQPAGANITQDQNETVITWDKTRYLDIRFYDASQESLLSIFGQFWLIIAVVLLLPFVLSRSRP